MACGVPLSSSSSAEDCHRSWTRMVEDTYSVLYILIGYTSVFVQEGLELVERGGHDNERRKSIPVIYGSDCERMSPCSCLGLWLPQLLWVASCRRYRGRFEELFCSYIHRCLQRESGRWLSCHFVSCGGREMVTSGGKAVLGMEDI